MKRDIAICIILSIVTCGIYSIYWFVHITNELNELYPDDYVTDGGMAFVYTLITCGIYGLYWDYKMGKKGGNDSSILFIILDVLRLGIVNYALLQDTINTAVSTQQRYHPNQYYDE